MQATSATYRPVTGADWLTTSSLILIVVFAVITLAAIVYGMRLASQRRAARLIEERRIQAEAMSEPPEPTLATSVAPPPSRFDTDSTRSKTAHAASETSLAQDVQPEAALSPSSPTPPASPVDPDPVASAPDLSDEPIAAAAPLGASPAVEAESIGAEPDRIPVDDRPITTLKGLGPKVAARLNDLGLHTIGDLAALDDAQVESIDARLGPFTGRMARDRWPEQARLLAAGDVATFEARFGRL